MTRNNIIDCWRGFAILSVLLLHCYIHLPFVTDVVPQKLLNIIFRSGYYGVMIFFVISGFLITSTSLKRWGNLKNISLPGFYQMRFARIMPSLLLLLAIMSVLQLLNVKGFVNDKTTLIEAIFAVLTFHINWLAAKVNYMQANWDVLWSLSVEEMFYLFFPILCLFLKRPVFFFILFALIILGPFARVSFSSNEIWSDRSYLSCMDGIAMGCLAAMIANRFQFKKVMTFILAIVGATFLISVLLFRSQVAAIGLTKLGLNVTLLELGMAMILIATTNLTMSVNFVLIKPLSWLGRLSYEIYLYHGFVIMIFANYIYTKSQSTALTLFEYALIIVLAGLLGKLIATYFSEPLNKTIRKINVLNRFRPSMA